MSRKNGTAMLGWYVALACLALFSVPASRALETATNVLPNSSFEECSEGKPVAWREQTWGGKGTFSCADTGRTGQRCVLIASEEGGDLSWGATVPVRPRATYRLAGWIKTENVSVAAGENRRGRGALLNLHNLQPVATRAVTGTQDWTRVEVVFETGAAGCGAGQLPVRRLGTRHRKGLVRRSVARTAVRGELATPDRDRRLQTGTPRLEVHLRPVHRAPRTLHLRRDLGGNARGPQVLLPPHGGVQALWRAKGGSGGDCFSCGQCFALADPRRGRFRADDRRGSVCRRAHAARRCRKRHPAGGSGTGRRQGVRRLRLAQGRRGKSHGDGDSRGSRGPRDARGRGCRLYQACLAVPGHGVHQPGRVDDSRRGRRLPDRHRVVDAGRQRGRHARTPWPCSRS